MYSTQEFLERYKNLEEWALRNYPPTGINKLEEEHPNGKIRSDVKFFRHVRNLFSHNTNTGIELTDEFKNRFEALCNNLMNSVSGISIPFNKIFKREISDKVIPTIAVMKEKTYTYVPVMNGKKVWGVFCEAALFNFVGDGNASLRNDNLKLLELKDYVTEYTSNGVFDFIGTDASIDDVRRLFAEAFNNKRRLDVLYITTTGDIKGDLVGLVTIWDLTKIE